MKETPVFSLDIPDPMMRLRNVEFKVTPVGWFTKLVWRIIKINGECTWAEEPVLTDENGIVHIWNIKDDE